MPLHDLDEIAASVVEHGRGHLPHRDWRLREAHTEAREPPMLRRDIVDREGSEGDAVRQQGRLERLRGRMRIGLEHELDAVRILRRHHGQSAMLAHRHILLALEAEHLGVEAQRLLLVIDQEARHDDPHLRSPC